MNLYYFASPATFYPLAGRLWPVFAVTAAVLAAAGLYGGLVLAPVDFQQGESYRIIFIHVPAAWMGMFIYLVMAFYGVLHLTYNTRLAAMMMRALAPTGALFTFLALWTGALWGRPTWGTYWIWDGRMTSTLVLFFLYVGFIALTHAIEETRRADRAGALLAIVGSVNIPIIYFSVTWWNSLHQGMTFSSKGSKMAPEMAWAMILMVFACWAYAIAVSLVRARALIREREAEAAWLEGAR